MKDEDIQKQLDLIEENKSDNQFKDAKKIQLYEQFIEELAKAWNTPKGIQAKTILKYKGK